MAIQVLPNQALGFNITEENCHCGGSYCQPVQLSDTYMLQGISTPVTGDNMIQPSWEHAVGADWTVGSRTDFELKGENNPGTATTHIPLGMQVGQLYKVDIDVTITNPANNPLAFGWAILIDGHYLKLPNTSLGLGYAGPLKATWFYLKTTTGNDRVQVEITDGQIGITVNSVSVKQMSRAGISFYNAAGTAVYNSFAPAFIEYVFEPDGYYGQTINELKWQASLAFGSILSTAACYQMAIYDSCLTGNNIVKNGTFATTFNHWSFINPGNNYWLISGGLAQYDAGAAPGSYTPATMVQVLKLKGGLTYKLEFDFAGVDGNMRVYFDTPDSSFILATLSETGHYEYSLDLTGYNGIVETSIAFAEFGTGARFNLDNVQVSTQQTSKDYLSACFDLRSLHECTLLLTATNNDGAFGFDYSEDFTHRLRIKAKMDLTSYPEEAETYIYSDNSEALLFGRTQKEHTIYITDAPNYIHDCLRHLRLHDTFTINSAAYVRQGGYELNRRRSSALKQSTFTVREAEGIASNYRLS